MDKNMFIDKHRKELRCKNPDSRTCWCEQCIKIERAWTSQINLIIMMLEDYAKTIEDPQKEITNAVVNTVRKCL